VFPNGTDRQHKRLIADVVAHDAGDEAPEEFDSAWDGFAHPDIELPETPKEPAD
jgi:hypothetical protein